MYEELWKAGNMSWRLFSYAVEWGGDGKFSPGEIIVRTESDEGPSRLLNRMILYIHV